jgi:hypothetical protein
MTRERRLLGSRGYRLSAAKGCWGLALCVVLFFSAATIPLPLSPYPDDNGVIPGHSSFCVAQAILQTYRVNLSYARVNNNPWIPLVQKEPTGG